MTADVEEPASPEQGPPAAEQTTTAAGDPAAAPTTAAMASPAAEPTTAPAASPATTVAGDPGAPQAGGWSQVDGALPYGMPGKPLARGPFLFGLVGGLGVLTAIAIGHLITNSLSVIILIVVAMFLAAGLNPAVEALQRRRMKRRTSISIVFAGVIVLFALFGLAIVPPVSQESADFIAAVPGYFDQLIANPTLRQLDADYQLLPKLAAFVTDTLAPSLAGGLVGAGLVVLDGVFTGVTLLVLMLYFLGSLHSIKEYLLKLVPASRRTRTAAITEEILDGIGGYVAGNILISVIAGVLSWAFLTVAGARYALALALVIALTDLIPLVGATIGAVLVSGVAFLQSVPLGIACAIFFLVYQQVENYLIYPRVMKRSVDVAPAVTVIAALFGGALLGIVGALLAIPVAAAIALIIREIVLPRQARS